MSKEYDLLKNLFVSEHTIGKLKLPPVIKLAMGIPEKEVPKKVRLGLALSELIVIMSNLNNKISLHKTLNSAEFVPVTINLETFLWSRSGSGKDKALNGIRSALEPAYDLIREKLDTRSLEVAQAKALKEVQDINKWSEYYSQIEDLHPSISTERGLVKHMAKLNEVHIGACSVYSSEFGAALTDDTENIKGILNVAAIGYDLGKVPAKLVSTADLQIKGIKGLNINLVMFSSLNAILRNEKAKKAFVTSMELQHARRGFHIVDSSIETGRSFDSLDELDKMIIEDSSASNINHEKLKTYVTELLEKKLSFNRIVQMDDEVFMTFHKYLEFNRLRSLRVPSVHVLYKTAVRHNQWRALKLAGGIALLMGTQLITMQHFKSAMSIVEELLPDIKLFESEINKEPFQLFVQYCHERTDIGKKTIGITKANLAKLSFITSATNQKVEELVLAANDTDTDGVYTLVERNNSIVFNRTVREEIEEVEDVKEVAEVDNTPKMVAKKPMDVAFKMFETTSKKYRMKNSYKEFTTEEDVSWSRYRELMCSNSAYSVYTYKNGERNNDNVQGTPHTILLDVDGGALPIKVMHKVLSDYNHIIATTSDKANKHKYRILLELDTALDLTAMQWKTFYKSLAASMGIEVDPNISQSGVMFGYEDSESYTIEGARGIPTKAHLIAAYDTDPLKYEVKRVKNAREFNDIYENRLEEFEFAYRATKSMRSSMLYAAWKRAEAFGFEKESIIELLEEINEFMPDGGIPQVDLEATILKYVK